MRQFCWQLQIGMLLKVRVLLIDSRVHHRPNDIFAHCIKGVTDGVRFDCDDALADVPLYVKVWPNPVNCIARFLTSSAPISLYQFEDDRFLQVRENVLIRQFALSLIYQISLSIRTANFKDILQKLRDLALCRRPTADKSPIDINDDRVDLIGIALRHELYQGERQNGAIHRIQRPFLLFCGSQLTAWRQGWLWFASTHLACEVFAFILRSFTYHTLITRS